MYILYAGPSNSKKQRRWCAAHLGDKLNQCLNQQQLTVLHRSHAIYIAAPCTVQQYCTIATYRAAEVHQIVLQHSVQHTVYCASYIQCYSVDQQHSKQAIQYIQFYALRSSNTHCSTMYQLDSVVLRCGAATLSAAVKISNSQWCTMYTVPVSFRDVLLTSTECHTREIHQSVPKCQESIISDTV